MRHGPDDAGKRRLLENLTEQKVDEIIKKLV
jgi:hypothetical protein